MKLPPPLVAGAIVGLTALGCLCSGPAHADTDKDPVGHSGRTVRASHPVPEVEDVSAFMAAVEAARLSPGGGMSSAAQQAMLGPGGPVPTVGMAGLVPNARALAAYVADTYPGVQAIGGVRADALPDHPSGHAIDIMIGSDMGLGDAISADIQGKAGRFNVSYTLWRVANHFNHVHVTVF